MKKIIAPVLLVCILALAWSCSGKQGTESKATADSLARVDSVAKAKHAADSLALTVAKDTLLDYTARFIAGLPQLTNNSFSALEKDKFWEEYKASMDASWKQMYDTRLSKIADWETGTLSSSINDSLTLFYPFSGPDFLHAYYLFPRTSLYVMAALEPVRPVPDLKKLQLKARDKFLDSLGNSLRDIFQKSYFITTHMQKDLKQVKGVLPPLYFFIERSGYELLSQKFITLDTAGNEKDVEVTKIHWQKNQGVKLVARNRETNEIKTIYYFSVSINNSGLKDRPGFVKFVKHLAPFNTFVKSASYLMHHKDEFATIRSMIVQLSQTVLQDDTGIPYKYFSSRLDWNGQFFGEYIKPVEDFSSGLYQKDLDSAFKASSKPLPFSLGYHWSTKKQNYMLFGRTKKLNLNK